MQPQFYMYCFPWDLEDEGLEESIGRLAGEIGVDGINVAATTSEILQYRPRKPLDKRVFKTEAGAHFQPDKKFYSSCRIKPHPAAWMKSRNALDRIVKVCEKEKLKVRASINCCVGRSMVERYTFAACVNALGLTSEWVLCPSHPDVGDYLRSMAGDLSSNYGLDAIEVTNLRRDDVFFDFSDHSLVRHAPTKVVELLMGICTCSSCGRHVSMQQEVLEATLSFARSRIVNWLDDPPADRASRSELLAAEQGIAAYVQSQLSSIVETLGTIKSASKCQVTTRYEGGLALDPIDCSSAKVIEHVDRIVLDSRSVDRQPNWLASILAKESESSKFEIAINTRSDRVEAAPDLVSTTYRLANRSFHTISYDGYDLATQPMLDAIRQAIRFARRETR